MYTTIQTACTSMSPKDWEAKRFDVFMACQDLAEQQLGKDLAKLVKIEEIDGRIVMFWERAVERRTCIRCGDDL